MVIGWNIRTPPPPTKRWKSSNASDFPRRRMVRHLLVDDLGGRKSHGTRITWRNSASKLHSQVVSLNLFLGTKNKADLVKMDPPLDRQKTPHFHIKRDNLKKIVIKRYLNAHFFIMRRWAEDADTASHEFDEFLLHENSGHVHSGRKTLKNFRTLKRSLEHIWKISVFLLV